MKRIGTLLLSITLLLSAAGCGSNATGTPAAGTTATQAPTTAASAGATTAATEAAATTAKKDPLTMRIMWWGSQTRHDRTLATLELYKTVNPHITMEPEFMGGGDYWQKLNTLVAANDVPEVFQIGNNFLTYEDAIEPLDAYVGSEVDISGTSDNYLNTTRVNGKLMGLSLGTNSLALVYDPAIFEKAGVSTPTENWTWDDFKTAAVTIKEKTGVYGSSLLNDFFIGCIISVPQYGTGETFYNADGTGLGYANDQFVADFLQMKLDLTKAGAYPSPAELAEIKDIEGDFLVTGKAAMTWVHSNQLVAMIEAAKRPLVITTPPKRTADGVSGLCIRSSQAMSVYSGSEHKSEAASFISWFVNDMEANRILDGERGVPMMDAVRADLAARAPEANKQMYDFVDLAGKLASNAPPVEPAAQTEINDILTRVGDEVVFGKITPAEAAAKLREGAVDAFARSAAQ